MKTAISLPDDLFAASEQYAARVGIPRSQLYAQALQEYLKRHTDQQVTERLDRYYGQLAELLPGEGFAAAEAAGLAAARTLTEHDTW
jgi:hypothetical protein